MVWAGDAGGGEAFEDRVREMKTRLESRKAEYQSLRIKKWVELALEEFKKLESTFGPEEAARRLEDWVPNTIKASEHKLVNGGNRQTLVISVLSSVREAIALNSPQNRSSSEVVSTNDGGFPDEVKYYKQSALDANRLLAITQEKLKIARQNKGRPEKAVLVEYADKCRKKNGKINYSKLAREKLRVSHVTAKFWCESYGIT